MLKSKTIREHLNLLKIPLLLYSNLKPYYIFKIFIKRNRQDVTAAERVKSKFPRNCHVVKPPEIKPHGFICRRQISQRQKVAGMWV